MPSNASPRRPKRASAVLADAKRKQNQDSSSEDDTHDIPKSLAPSRSKSSLSTGSGNSGVTINRSNKRRRASSNASSSSLSSVSSIHDARPTPNKRFRKVAPPNNSSMPILKVQGPSDLQPSRLAPFISFSREFRRADSVRSTQSTSTVPDGALASSQNSMSSIFPSLPDRNTSPDEWDPDNVVRPKALVFVKLTHCPPAPTSINDQGVVWWPVSVSKDGTDKVVLWNGTRHELLSMPSPTANNIVPAKDRFDNPNFNLSTYFVGSTTKPSGLDQLWTQTMRMTGVEDEDEDEDDRDGLQDSIYHVTANLSGTTSDVTEENITDPDDLEAEELQARLVDQRLTHIGKPVIVRLRNKDKYWWPARVIEIDISVSAKEIVYTVDVWEAARPKKVTRANLCFSTDPGFLTYSLGGREFTNSISSATEDEVRHWKMTEKVKREMTAIEAIIKDEYPPARKEVDYWYEHGVRHDKPSLGGEHQGELLHALLDVLLGETSANARFSSVEPTDGDDGLYEPVSDVPPSTVTSAAAGPLVKPASSTTSEDPRQPLEQAIDPTSTIYAPTIQIPRGSARYEALDKTTKIKFFGEILTIEVARQFAIRHIEPRTSSGLLPDDREAELYDEACRWIQTNNLPNEDIYHEVETLRKERVPFVSVDLPSAKQSTEALTGGTRTRPKQHKSMKE